MLKLLARTMSWIIRKPAATIPSTELRIAAANEWLRRARESQGRRRWYCIDCAVSIMEEIDAYENPLNSHLSAAARERLFISHSDPIMEHGLTTEAINLANEAIQQLAPATETRAII
ncbi:MAG: hypothetical protein IT450_09975 [Phycisphaerales bacterium]|nr:hypothetical protein [Phycisphaerales bacterium]